MQEQSQAGMQALNDNIEFIHYYTFYFLDLQEAFALFDCDRDGEITVQELGKVNIFIYFKNTSCIH